MKETQSLNLRELRVTSPEALKSLPLEVALLQNGSDSAVGFWAMYMRRRTSWHTLPFSDFDHADAVLRHKQPHIFVTHWHMGWNHNYENPITQLVAQLKITRGHPGIGTGPFIVGTYRRDANYYEDYTFLPFIEKTYDYHMAPVNDRIFGSQLIDILVLELWKRLPGGALFWNGSTLSTDS